MSHYAIGDIQGCYDALQRLLTHVHFDPAHDQLWLVGDVVNRGPQSLEVLRFLRELGPRATMVLGNHDFHLICVFYGHQSLKDSDTLGPVLQAPDAAKLVEWLCQQPLVHHDATLGFTMAHAGIPPQWTIADALMHAQEVEATLRGPNRQAFLHTLYGSEPAEWQESLNGFDRLRYCVNAFTRMRFCDATGRLELKSKGSHQQAPQGCAPWFRHPNRKARADNIVFGHWAALDGITHTPHAWATDTGCAWGKSLTALRLEDQTRHSVPA